MKLIISIALICFSIVAYTDTATNSNMAEVQKKIETKLQKAEKFDCMPQRLKLLRNQVFRDTIIEFRNSVFNDTSVMVICDKNQIDVKLEKILIESKYLPYHAVNGYKSFILCLRTYDCRKEIGFFHVKLATSKAWEVRRFLIENYKITGLICLPGIVNKFTSTEEYDKEVENIIVE